MSTGEKLTKWLVFSVAMALLPLVFNAVSLLTRAKSVDFGSILGRGDLLLITVAISAAAVGDLVGGGGRGRARKHVVAGFNLLIVMLNSLWYADLSGLIAAGTSYRADVVSYGSVGIFICSVVTSGMAVVLSEE